MFYLTMQHFKYSSNSVLAEYTQLALFRDEKGRQKKLAIKERRLAEVKVY